MQAYDDYVLMKWWLLYDSYKRPPLAEASLHSLWQIMMSNSDELKSG